MVTRLEGERRRPVNRQGNRDCLPGENDSPQGADGEAARDGSRPARRALHRPGNKEQRVMPAKTMEEVASYGNLKEAFKQVASNKGAPGPDGKSIEEVRVRLGEIISLLHEKLLDESYRVGMSRRVWIPKPGGKGERGLGIPNVIDRIVQQAVQQVLSPHYEPTFHGRQPWISSWAQLSHSHRGAKSYLDDGYEWVVDMDLEK